MTLLAVGVSHHTARVDQREKVSLSGRACTLLQALARAEGICEAVALSTCNRTEVYAVVGSQSAGSAAISRALVQTTDIAPVELARISYTLTGADVVRHLLRVAASLDSMVVGESEIQGQVRAALGRAEAHGTAGKCLRELFRHALVVGKRVRRETAIGRGAVSCSSVAVELVREALPDLTTCSALLIGAGHVAEATAGALMASGVRVMSVANRSVLAAEELAERFGGRGVALDELVRELSRVDIVICSTDSPRPIVMRAHLEAAARHRAERPLVLIDIAVPRDVEPSVRTLPGTILKDIDDLERVVRCNLNGRLREAEHAKEIVEQELRRVLAREGSTRPDWLAATAA